MVAPCACLAYHHEVRALLCLALTACVPTGTALTNRVFTRTSSSSRSDEIARRTLPPLTYRRIHEALVASGKQLADQPIELAREHFDIYVPHAAPPARGYGLIVFVPAWDEPTRPQVLRGPLDDRGLIFVAAQRSGNRHPILDRRLPLALLAYENVRAQYPIDPARTYVMGMSGGARVAEIIALAYPDIFRGAILNAGSDPIDGRAGTYKPPADLFRQLQRSRLVLITGDQDEDNRKADDVSLASLRASCVLDVHSEVALHQGHELVNARAFATALDTLESSHPIDEAALARCNATVAHTLQAELATAADLIARGAHAAARAKLNAIDAHYGGLAAPAIYALDAQLR